MNWLIEILKKRSWKVYAFMYGIFFFLFLLSFFSSKYLLEVEPEKVKEVLTQIESSPIIQEFRKLLEENKYFEIFTLIFFHNFQIAIINYFFGIGFLLSIHNFQIAIINYFFGIGFLLSILLQASNGFLIGFLLGISPEFFPNFFELIGFLIVMILEVVAITSTAVEGMYLTYTFFRPEKMWKTKSKTKAIKKTLSQSIKIILLSALLLFLAALIETIVIYYQSSVNIKPILIGV
ncbi:MAG: stage II sporulation protein M [Candidatus Aenigmarchaeota archaeon]|nr:stage II sporulation protein M [Candidatus Aenigmarchaeota archaeon]